MVDFLIRFRDKEEVTFEHEAEQQILFNLCAMLEYDFPELLSPHYVELLEIAREKVANLDYESELSE